MATTTLLAVRPPDGSPGDHHLTSSLELAAFQAAHGVATTAQIFGNAAD